MKKIIHIVEAFGGGIYTYLKILCNGLSDDYEVIVIYSKREETPENFRNDFKSNIKFINIKMCRNLNPYLDVKSFFEIKKIIKNEKPDIIHLHSSKAGALGRMACKMNKFDMNNVFYNPHGFSFLMNDTSNIKRKIYYLLEKMMANLGGNVIGCSKGEYKQAIKLTNKAFLINNCIDLNQYQSFTNYKRENNDSIKIGMVGRISNQKNPKLFNEIAMKFPNINFVWIGYGNLEKLLYAKNITIKGWLNHNDAMHELMKLDIYIMTSLWEGLPISLLEAMYLKKPSVVSNVIGNNDVIVNGENGFIANDLDDFIKYIKLLITNKEIREKVSQNAYIDVINNYNSKQMIKNYTSLYDKNLLNQE